MRRKMSAGIMNKKIDVYASADYAGLETNDYKFYFGYEHEEDGEWCFTAKSTKFTGVFVLKQSELKGVSTNADMYEYLLAGIGMFINSGGMQ